ncbi:MAG: YbhB/YbcL family Raf kinase inhibitor-like protein [Betaproteobacteria bacterium]|nr:YbhB/YbcL family Raf kinase inhibitor-like protein [Betaproteobacteria bacterium]
MELASANFAHNQKIPGEYAFAVPDPASHIKLSQNRNPALAWSDLPPGVKSLVLICHDYDVPSRADDVNKEGRTIPALLPRVDFHHWVLVDLDPNSGPVKAGEFSDGVTPRGKKGWNDEIVHHYVFTLYAVDIAKCPVSGIFKGPDVLAAIRGHVLEQASLTGVYSLNPRVRF